MGYKFENPLDKEISKILLLDIIGKDNWESSQQIINEIIINTKLVKINDT